MSYPTHLTNANNRFYYKVTVLAAMGSITHRGNLIPTLSSCPYKMIYPLDLLDFMQFIEIGNTPNVFANHTTKITT